MSRIMRGELAAALTAAQVEDLDRDGFLLVKGALSCDELAAFAGAIAEVGAAASQARGGDVYAIRDLLRAAPRIVSLARCVALRDLVVSVLGPTPLLVRGIFFDKSLLDANWNVAWHQDRTIAVRQREEATGYGPWSIKQGVPHVEPPPALLASMLTLRLHLDDADENNGALRVLPGTHQLGRIDAVALPGIVAHRQAATCRTSAGDVLLMRPLLLHASSAAATDRRRRVVHLEFAAGDLPPPLVWAEAHEMAR